MDADERCHGQECLAGNAPSQQGRIRFAQNLELPTIQAQADVAIEPAGSTRVRGKVRKRMPDVGPGHVNAVVAQKHAVPICLITWPLIVARLCRAHFHASAKTTILRAELPADPARLYRIEADGHQVNVRPAHLRHPGCHGAIDIEGVAPFRRIHKPGSFLDDGHERARNPARLRSGNDHSIGTDTLQGVVMDVGFHR
jgi:hypothetical protein